MAALEYNMHMILQMLRWWYGTGWLQATHRVTTWTKNVERAFSFTLLLQTLFSPWRRIISAPGRGLDAKMRAALDNFVSRCVGFFVRIGVILAGAFTMLGAFVGGVVLAGIWPLLPVAVIYFLIRSVTG